MKTAVKHTQGEMRKELKHFTTEKIKGKQKTGPYKK